MPDQVVGNLLFTTYVEGDYTWWVAYWATPDEGQKVEIGRVQAPLVAGPANVDAKNAFVRTMKLTIQGALNSMGGGKRRWGILEKTENPLTN